MWVLWAYCPRSMVALAGQHSGYVEVMLVNFTPWLVIFFFKAGIAFSVPGNWSSVRTKIMLGLVAAAPAFMELIAVRSTTTLARSSAVANETDSRTALPIPTRPSLVRRRKLRRPYLFT